MIYDTVGSPETVEVGIRVLRERGTLVQMGVSSPARFEWTPWYFKELRLVGSNAFGIEEVDGVRKHGIAHYLDLVQAGRIDLAGMLTHTFRLEQWRDALAACADQATSGAREGRLRLPRVDTGHEPEHRHQHRRRPGGAGRVRPASAPDGPEHPAPGRVAAALAGHGWGRRRGPDRHRHLSRAGQDGQRPAGPGRVGHGAVRRVERRRGSRSTARRGAGRARRRRAAGRVLPVIAGEHSDWDEYRAAMVKQGKSLLRITPERWGPVATGGFPPDRAP